eukprot:gene1065-biopygen1697
MPPDSVPLDSEASSWAPQARKSIMTSEGRADATGLRNLHNSCWLNAPIQCLAMSRAFVEEISSGRFLDDILCREVGVNERHLTAPATRALATTFHDLLSGEFTAVAPREMRIAATRDCKVEDADSAHSCDSYSFLSALLLQVHEETNSGDPTIRRTTAGVSADEVPFWSDIAANHSPVTRCFHGVLIIERVQPCGCKHRTAPVPAILRSLYCGLPTPSPPTAPTNPPEDAAWQYMV